jgi:transposase
MSKPRLVITAVVVEGRTQAEVARTYGVSKSWVSKLVARYQAEGEAAFEPRSRRPKTTPNATPAATVELIVALRRQLSVAGLDAGPDTIRWHLEQQHQIVVSRATIARHLTRAGLITPEPKKRPKNSNRRFEAAMPNETWQTDFTHYPLADGTDVEILPWLDDCTRYAIRVTAHHRVTGDPAELRQPPVLVGRVIAGVKHRGHPPRAERAAPDPAQNVVAEGSLCTRHRTRSGLSWAYVRRAAILVLGLDVLAPCTRQPPALAP